MVYKITLEPTFLRAELFDRETVDEVKSFLRAVARASVKHQRGCILVRIHPLTPIFQDDVYGLVRQIAQLPLPPSWKIALLGDTTDFHGTHESVEAVSARFKLNLWVFPDEVAALDWFRDWRERGERRRILERRQPCDQLSLPALHHTNEWRRQGERRSSHAALFNGGASQSVQPKSR